MTTEAGEPRRDSRLMMLAGHYASLALLAAVTLIVANDATDQRYTALVWVTNIAFLACVAVMFASFGYHNARLCERCITATPLDPQAAVRRWDAALRFDHMKRLKLLAYIVLLGADIAAGWHGWSSGGWGVGQHLHWWGDVADIVFVVFLGAIYGAEFRHRRLYPWCPYCHWGGGGDHEPKMVDVPDPAVSK
jgi:hypothetical protein